MQRGSGPGARDICLGDAQRGLPLAHAVAQLQPGAESGDPVASGFCMAISSWLARLSAWKCRRAASHCCQPSLDRSCSTAPAANARSARRRSARSSSLRARRGLGRGPPLGSGCRGARDRSPPAPHAQRANLGGVGPAPGGGCVVRRPGGRRPRRLRPSPRPAAWVRCRPLRSRGLAALRLRGLFVARVSALNRPLQSAQRDA